MHAYTVCCVLPPLPRYELALAAPTPSLPQSVVPAASVPAAGGLPDILPTATAGPGATAAAAAKLDLKRDIAHNMVLLYRASGAQALARQLMVQYLVV